MSGVGSSPALATCETSQVLLAGVSGGFPGVLPFRPTYRLARFDMSEIILKGTLNYPPPPQKKKKKKKKKKKLIRFARVCSYVSDLFAGKMCYSLTSKDFFQILSPTL